MHLYEESGAHCVQQRRGEFAFALWGETKQTLFAARDRQGEYDEGDDAREKAARAGASFHPIPIRQSDLADNFADAIWHSETLRRNGHGVSKFLLSWVVRDAGYKVVFTGEGSDEIFGGYIHFRTDILLYNTQGQDAAEVQRLVQQLETANSVSRGMLMPAGETGSLESVKRLLGFVPGLSEGVHSGGPGTADALRRRLSKHGLRDALVSGLSGCACCLKLNGRDPLAKPMIGETVYRRQKHPLLSPPVTMVPTERFHEMMQDTLRGPVFGRYRFPIRTKSSPCLTNCLRCRIRIVFAGIPC